MWKASDLPLGHSPKNTGTGINPQVMTASSWTLWPRASLLALEPLWALPFWLKPQWKILWDMFQPFYTSFSRLSPGFSSHSRFLCQPPHLLWNLLTVSNIILLHHNKLNPDPLLHTITKEVLCDCLLLMDHLLTPCNDLQEIPLGNNDFSRFTDGSYLKGDSGKYCAGYAITAPFDVVKAAF